MNTSFDSYQMNGSIYFLICCHQTAVRYTTLTTPQAVQVVASVARCQSHVAVNKEWLRWLAVRKETPIRSSHFMAKRKSDADIIWSRSFDNTSFCCDTGHSHLSSISVLFWENSSFLTCFKQNMWIIFSNSLIISGKHWCYESAFWNPLEKCDIFILLFFIYFIVLFY